MLPGNLLPGNEIFGRRGMGWALKTKPGCMQSSGKPGIRGKGKKKKSFGGEKN